MNELQKVTGHPEPRYKYAELKAMSEEISKSGLFKMTPPQILTLMLLSESTGLHPIQALTRYHIIEGRPSMRADAMQALFQANGGRIEWTKDTETECEAVFYHDQYCKAGKIVSFTMTDARRAGLESRAVWKQHPRSMLRARVISNGVRMIDPSVILGIYTPDEIESIDITPTSSEQVAHAGIRDKLRARVAPADRTPVAQVVQELKAAEQPKEHADNHGNGNGNPGALAPEAKSEFRSWVEDTLQSVNAELHAISEANPSQVGLRVGVKTPQVINHLMTEAIEAGRLDERAIMNSAGKRNNSQMGFAASALWDDDSAWCMDVLGKYLANKVQQAQSRPAGSDIEAA